MGPQPSWVCVPQLVSCNSSEPRAQGSFGDITVFFVPKWRQLLLNDPREQWQCPSDPATGHVLWFSEASVFLCWHNRPHPRSTLFNPSGSLLSRLPSNRRAAPALWPSLAHKVPKKGTSLAPHSLSPSSSPSLSKPHDVFCFQTYLRFLNRLPSGGPECVRKLQFELCTSKK